MTHDESLDRLGAVIDGVEEARGALAKAVEVADLPEVKARITTAGAALDEALDLLLASTEFAALADREALREWDDEGPTWIEPTE